jgi:putative ABC transport system permease protein
VNLADRWREIFDVLWRRRLRTVLTALSVAWGIFMLVVLLGAGNGLSNGAQAEFSRDAMNSVWVNPGRTSKAHGGHPAGRGLNFTLEDFEFVRDRVPVAEHTSAKYSPPNQLTVSFEGREASFGLRGVFADHIAIERSEIKGGRFLNDLDVAERRKVAVIGRKVRETLFPGGRDPVGAFFKVGTVAYQVVGHFDEENDDREQQMIYVPISTAQMVHGGKTGGPHHVDEVMFTTTPADAAELEGAIDELRRAFSVRHEFARDDKRAMWVWNSAEMAARLQGLFGGIRAFVWLIGLGTILAGVVGVSNIMLISVQERTREIGVRKALGATPAALVRMIVEEALAITMVSGYLGLVAGVAVLTAVAKAVPKAPFFQRPEVDLRVALAATGVLVLAGALAGLFPALRAARVNPIQAMRVE